MLMNVQDFENVGISESINDNFEDGDDYDYNGDEYEEKRNWREITCALSTAPSNQADAPESSLGEQHQHL